MPGPQIDAHGHYPTSRCYEWEKAGEQQRMFSTIIRAACFAVLFLGLIVNNGIALTYLDPNDKDKSIWFKRMLNNSIPFYTGERVVIERKGVVSPWVVALIHLNYEDVRRQRNRGGTRDINEG